MSVTSLTKLVNITERQLARLYDALMDTEDWWELKPASIPVEVILLKDFAKEEIEKMGEKYIDPATLGKLEYATELDKAVKLRSYAQARIEWLAKTYPLPTPQSKTE